MLGQVACAKVGLDMGVHRRLPLLSPRVRRDVPEEDPQMAMRRDTFTAEEWHTFMLSMLVSTEPMAARFRSLFSWLYAAVGRGDEARHVRLCHVLKPCNMPCVGPSPFTILAFMLRGGKKNKVCNADVLPAYPCLPAGSSSLALDFAGWPSVVQGCAPAPQPCRVRHQCPGFLHGHEVHAGEGALPRPPPG